ncbi:MAG: hypothetical protein AAFU81_11715, partial [Pseudomonadota bacterium]
LNQNHPPSSFDFAQDEGLFWGRMKAGFGAGLKAPFHRAHFLACKTPLYAIHLVPTKGERDGMQTWLFVLAGFVATAVTLLRTFAGGAIDLEPLLAALGDNSLKGVVLINWHALNAIFAVLSIAPLLAARLSNPRRVVIGVLSALVFGITCVIFMTVTALETGSPFTYPPFIPLGLASGLSATAAWMSRR